MYIGYVISQAGLLLTDPTLINTLIIITFWVLFVRRILAEERVLYGDTADNALRAAARGCLFPGIY